MKVRRDGEGLTQEELRVLTVPERKGLLSAYARMGNKKLLDPVSALRELNKMEGAYPPEKHLVAHVDVLFIIGKGYQDKPLSLGASGCVTQKFGEMGRGVEIPGIEKGDKGETEEGK